VPVVATEAPAFLHLRIARLMQAHDDIDSTRFARGDEGVGAEGAVGEEDVALAQMPQHALGEQRVVSPSFAFDCGHPGAAVQVEEAE
jgi:hypothetical protein